MDFQSVVDWKSNELSKADYGRMPWHASLWASSAIACTTSLSISS
jgi:hypothetical protein